MTADKFEACAREAAEWTLGRHGGKGHDERVILQTFAPLRAEHEAMEAELTLLRELAEAGARYSLGEHGFTWFDDSEAMLVVDERDFSESAKLAHVAFKAETRFECEWIGHNDYDVYRASLDALRAAQKGGSDA